MSVTPEEFKSALSRFASGVTAVTTRDPQGRPLGLTVSAFCSVSLDPPLVLVSIDNRSETCDALRETGVFGISVLAEHQREVSQAFATAGPEKFARLVLEEGVSGVPLVPEALARLECRLHAAHVAGDHTLFVGLVERAETRPGRPLVYHTGGYRALAEATAGPQGGTAGSDRV